MATNMKISGEVVKVEKKQGYIDDYLEVTVKGSRMTLTFGVPVYKAKSYSMGRFVSVGVNAKD
jgi:ribosomal protein S8